MIRPLISVCIATYNGEKFIVEQLKTILSQLTDFDTFFSRSKDKNLFK